MGQLALALADARASDTLKAQLKSGTLDRVRSPTVREGNKPMRQLALADARASDTFKAQLKLVL